MFKKKKNSFFEIQLNFNSTMLHFYAQLRTVPVCNRIKYFFIELSISFLYFANCFNELRFFILFHVQRRVLALILSFTYIFFLFFSFVLHILRSSVFFFCVQFSSLPRKLQFYALLMSFTLQHCTFTAIQTLVERETSLQQPYALPFYFSFLNFTKK